jgi:putative redox protein
LFVSVPENVRENPCGKIFIPLRGVITMASQPYKATVHYVGDEFFIGIPPSGHAQTIDTKGERRAAPSPLEMLLVSVAGCTAADVISILLKKRQDVRDYKVEIIGTRVDEHPRKFVAFHVHHIVHGRSVSEKAVADAIELSDTKYCSVAATVRPTAEITTSYEIVEVSE